MIFKNHIHYTIKQCELSSKKPIVLILIQKGLFLIVHGQGGRTQFAPAKRFYFYTDPAVRTYYNVAGAIPALRNKVVIFHQNISILIERTEIFSHKSGVLRTATSNQTSVKL